MRYAKYIGAVLGYIVWGFWGAIFGFIAGAWIANRFRRSSAGLFGINPQKRALRQSTFTRTLFLLMGNLAKSDGRVSEVEIAQAEKFMTQLAMTPEGRKEAIGAFKLGTQPDFSVDDTINEFKAVCGEAKNLRQLIIMYLLGTAMADGKMVEAEQSLLQEIAIKLGFSQQSFQQLLMMIQAQSNFSGGSYHGAGGQSRSANPTQSIDAAYQALGVEKTISDAELKRAYRKLIKEFHPDRLMGQGLPDDMIKVATERSKEIQTAYDMIKEKRGMR
ncbi:co-chaperone DjlA [Leucothrix arctica]|uniref:Co-chaperone DjlA n=1 Tax=Leucothrix arctica TaxID=1481894 RepID=A0A317CCQ6_9GAMM|nr:co-chaperone DjlA [Leucothrix arctica]PWQ95901.1 co-chaperone DjlA [Leucothrix arctica]